MLERLWFYIVFPGAPIAIALWAMFRMVKQRKETTKLPIKAFPRPAGWSLQRRTQDLREDFLVNLVFLASVGVIAALTFILGQSVIAGLVVGLLFSVPLLLRMQRQLPRLLDHNLGLLGEQVTGRVLDELSGPDLRVLHDYECSLGEGRKWNIDHIVVATHGIYAIETKMKRKKRNTKDNWTLKYDGIVLEFPDRVKTSRPVKQAKDAGDYLRRKIVEWNTSSTSVTSVLVYPGWKIDRLGKGEVAVLSAEGLPSFLSGRKAVLSREEVTAISNQIREKCLVELG